MRISELLRQKHERVVTLPANASAAEAAQLMKSEAVDTILIRRRDGRVVGVLDEHDLTTAIADHGRRMFEMPVSELMSNAPSAAPGDPVRETMRVMSEAHARHMCVVDGEAVVGVLGVADLLTSRLAEKVQENAVLQDLARARLPA